MRRRIGVLAAVSILCAYGLCRAADPSVLWDIVNDQCVPHQQAGHDPAPCSLVDLSQGREHGYVILKDIRGIAQFLLMPTARITGLESPELLAPGMPNFWDFAWRARHFVDERLHTELPRQSMSLATNSMYGRTQNQMHIHIDCVRTDVRDALATHVGAIGPGWAPFPVPLAGHVYRAMRVDGQELGANDPLRLLVATDPAAAADPGAHTLVVVGMVFPDTVAGFVILDDKADRTAGNWGSGEELQDHTCAIAQAG